MGAIGKWTDHINAATEDAILTRVMIPFNTHDGRGGGCIVGQAQHAYAPNLWSAPYAAWNALCMRYAGCFSRRECIAMLRGNYPNHNFNTDAAYAGGAKAAMFLRNRILKNRARRALAQVPILLPAEEVTV